MKCSHLYVEQSEAILSFILAGMQRTNYLWIKVGHLFKRVLILQMLSEQHYDGTVGRIA